MQIDKLSNSDIGRYVLFNTYTQAVGRIKSWNDNWVFVVYNCNNDWDKYQDYTAAATDPSKLDFISREDFYRQTYD